MIGIILVGHAHIAQEMKRAVEHILGSQAYMETLDVLSSDAPQALQDKLEEMVCRCNRGAGVLVFADMFGGTPCNIALTCLQRGECEVISGFNLPALVKAASKRMDADVDLTTLAKDVVKAGQQYVCLASDFMVVPHVEPVQNGKVSSHA